MSKKKTAKPIKSIHDIELIRNRLGVNVRNLLIFDFVTQTGLPSRLWLKLKVKDIWDLKPEDKLPIRGKVKAAGYNPRLTVTLHQTITEMIRKNQPKSEDYVFRSRKGSEPMSISSVSRLVKGWLEELGFTDLDGLLTLRKTWEHYFRPKSVPALSSYNEFDVPPKEIKYPTRQEIIYDELEKEIVMGILKPRQRLIAERIAKRIGVSPIPVREALGRLEARGFIIKRSQRDTVVRELSKEDFIEILKLRITLECMAARSACVKHSHTVLDKLAKVHVKHAKYRDMGDSDALLLQNKIFHFTIYQAAERPMLFELISLLWGRVSPYHHIFHRQSEIPNPKPGTFYHEKILAGMTEKNPAKVSRWLKTDLRVSAEFLLKLFDHYQKKQNS